MFGEERRHEARRQDQFFTWQQLSIGSLTQYKKFVDLLTMIEKGKSLKTRPTEILTKNRERSTEISSLDRRGTNVSKGRSKDKNLNNATKVA